MVYNADDLVSPHCLHQASPHLSATSSKMENTTPIECKYFYYYVPDYNSSPASCINEFKDLADLIDYIDTQTVDCYEERNDFVQCHTGTDGEVLDVVNMTVKNVYDEEIVLKIYDQNMSRVEITFEIRQQLEEIAEIFQQISP